MDFFEHQDLARRNSRRLIWLFALSVVVLVAVFNVVVHFALGILDNRRGVEAPPLTAEDYRLAYLATTAFALAIIGGTAVFKLKALGAGGSYVAERLGGTLVQRHGADEHHTRLLNVVEEMAVASGVPMPKVYVLEGEGRINAFAAGLSSSDAVVAVTAGALRSFSRDELQGVIAHEFSHIINGDMRLNLRIIGVLFGILAISLAGSMLLRMIFYSGGARRRSDRNGGGQVVIVIACLGGAMWLLGALGHLFGQIIKAAVSRQREYLADAAAVQFTRNPQGIAGALRKIGARTGGSRLAHSKAQEMSHLFFSPGVAFAASALSTHPPLPKRIRRIQPDWDGTYLEPEAEPEPETPTPAGTEAPRGPERAGGRSGTEFMRDAVIMGTLGGAGRRRIDPEAALASVGTPSPQQIAFGHGFVRDLPDRIHQAVEEPHGARAVIYALLLDAEDATVREAQMASLRAGADPGVLRELERIAEAVRKLGDGARLPLLDLALSPLRELTADQYRVFMQQVDGLITADDHVTSAEYAIATLLRHHLGRARTPGRTAERIRHHAIAPLADPITLVLSTLAHFGHRASDQAEAAYTAGRGKLELQHPLRPESECTFEAFDQALRELRRASLGIRRRVLQACLWCAAADREVTIGEGELVRVIADLLECPLPPFVDLPSDGADPDPQQR